MICYLQFTIAVSYINLNIIVIAIIYNNSVVYVQQTYPDYGVALVQYKQ